tara:strand:+ start:815 stop:1216 length:402 start_codon:yes stop_codon:yes gene_type:complete
MKDFRPLFVIENLQLKFQYESAFLVNYKTGQVLLEYHFYGDPTCGLVADDEAYALIGGDHLTNWTPRKSKRFDDGPRWIYAIREKDQMRAEFLTDPWHEDSAIWEINTLTFEIQKVRDFLDYHDKEYVDEVIW